MKSLSAILFSLLLVLAQFAPATAAYCKPAMNCSAACRQMPCCAAKTSSSSQPAPAVPVQKNSEQNQISLLASAVALWTLPENPARAISSVTASPSLAVAAPLYARNCSRLL